MGIILARMLAPSDFGKFALVSATISSLLIPFGLTLTPLLVVNSGKSNVLFGNVFGIMCFTALVKLAVVFLFIVFQLFNNRLDLAILAFLIGLPVALFDLPETLRADLEGKGRFFPNLLVQAISLITHAIASISLVKLGWGVYGLATGGFVAYLPQVVTYFIVSRRKLSDARFNFKEIKPLLSDGLAFWLSQCCTNLNSRLDKIVLGLYGGETQLGYYNRAFNYAPFGMFILSSFLTNASVVAIKQQEIMSLKIRLALRMGIVMLIGALANWAVLWYFSDPIVPWLFGPQWEDAIPAFKAFSFLSIATAVHYLPMNFLLANNANQKMAAGKIIGFISLLFILFFLILNNSINEISVAYAFSLSMFISGLSNFIFSLSVIHEKSWK